MKAKSKFILFGHVFIILATFLLAGCATFNQTLFSFDEHYKERLHVRERNNLKVEVAALSNKESVSHFGYSLNEVGVQAIYVKITNNNNVPRLLFPIASDPDYYPPYEIARRIQKAFNINTEDTYKKLHNQLIHNTLNANTVSEGFLYTHADEGMKSIWIEMEGVGISDRFHFVVPVPGLPSNYYSVDQEVLDAHRATAALNREELRSWLQTLSCCTVNIQGVSGDPMNISFIGSMEEVRAALIGRHWDVTEPISNASIRRMIGAFFSGSRYRYAPISPLFFFDREHDLAFQKARQVIDERLHLRLWLAPVDFEGRSVWVGQISRDIGVKMTWKLWPPTTHIIDPDVDEARFYLLQDLMEDKHLQAFAYTEGISKTTLESPSYNAEKDPYFTDGLRTLFILSEGAHASEHLHLWPWSFSDKLKPFADIVLDEEKKDIKINSKLLN